MESGILGYGIRNTVQGFRNPTYDWNPESKSYLQGLESSTSNPESTGWNPESKGRLVQASVFCLSFSYALMTDCWKQNPDERPSFKELVEMLENLMLQDVEYFDFNLLDETKDYYQFQESMTGEVNSDNRSWQEKVSSIDLAI